MKRVRFAPSPTGSLHVGNALSAVANRALGDWMLLRIDDTDPARNLPGGADEAVRRYLDELGLPKHDVHYDLPRIRRLAIEAIGAMPDEELAERAGAPVELVPALRGARDLNEARAYARAILEPPDAVHVDSPETLERFRELLDRDGDPRELVRELKAVGGNLRALRLALTGADRGPELWTVVAALPREEALRRIDAAL